jgi:hypothetical protein
VPGFRHAVKKEVMMFSRKSVWGAGLLVLALPAFLIAQDAPAPDTSTQGMQSCPMMQSGSGMPMMAGMMQQGTMQQGMMQQGMMQPGTMQPGAMQPGMMMQRMRGMPGTQMPQAMGYDKASETTVTGTVADVVEPQGTGGLHLTFKTADETMDVHLGPKAWLDSHGYTFKAGDELTILGSKTTTHDMATMTNKTVVVAREITKHGETMVLRDENGRPLWAGPGRSQ